MGNHQSTDTTKSEGVERKAALRLRDDRPYGPNKVWFVPLDFFAEMDASGDDKGWLYLQVHMLFAQASQTRETLRRDYEGHKENGDVGHKVGRRETENIADLLTGAHEVLK